MPVNKYIFEPKRRILDNITIPIGQGCWEWTGGLQRTHGYGVVSVNNKSMGAHRLSYELFVGPIPIGKQINHLCNNKKCVAPTHIIPCSPRENILHAIAIGVHENHHWGINQGRIT